MGKRRNESFFGMHFDFHAGPNETNIGKTLDGTYLSKLLEEVKPDYIQCDCKGHHGICSYPTKVGKPAPEMNGDILRLWREITEKYGVSLYAHYSGVWDAYQSEIHPEWAAIDQNGKKDKFALSVFSKYNDEVLIPQLCELAKEYNLDGVWIDGDCWGTICDFSDNAKKEYYKRTGKNIDELVSIETELEEYKQFCRQGFFEYVVHYCNEVHKKYPNFQIASNWTYSSYAPHKPYEGIDFISGDFSMKNSLNTAFFEGRCLQHYSKPWDLMAWGFNTPCSKSYVQLCQEAASIIALGGGFQVYNPQMYDKFQYWNIDTWAALSKFARDRENTCFKAKPYHEGCVLYSEKAIFNHKSNMFRWDSDTNHYGISLHSLLYLLLENQYSTEMIMSNQLYDMSDEEFQDYSFIALGSQDTIEDDIKKRLLNYVSNGGHLIITGIDSCKLFEKELGVKITDSDKTEAFPCVNGKTGYIKSKRVKVTLNGANSTFYSCDAWRSYNQSDIISTCISYGKGTISGVYLDLHEYQYAKNFIIRDFIDSVVKNVYKERIVSIDKTHNVQIILTTKDGKLNVNILNTSGNHSDEKYLNFDEIPPLYDLDISIKIDKRPTKITQMPENKNIDINYDNGYLKIKLPKLEIHTVFVLE